MPVVVALLAAPAAAASNDLQNAAVWLEGKSLQLVRQSRRTMADGTAGFLPQAGGEYPAFWLRDYAYMLEGCPEAFTGKELRDAAVNFVNAQDANGNGIECIGLDGTLYYKPGLGVMGENPVTDGGPFTVDVAWRTHQTIQDVSFVNLTIDKLVKTMNAVPRDPANGLVYIDPTKAWDRCPYGFTDSVRKTGDVLYTSLLDVRSSRQLADLLDAAGRSTEAAQWRASADAKTVAIRDTFWDSSTGLFRAATVNNNLPDIWGSAFAVELGVATDVQKQAIGQYFVDHYGEIVQAGQVRETPADVNWDGFSATTYAGQHGGFWGVATGWVSNALRAVDSPLADQIILEMTADYQTNGVNEWRGGGQFGVPNYVSSATMPLATLKQLGALPALPVLAETGGTFLANNAAAASAGAAAFAKDVISGYAIHEIDNLNDGLYGNDHSWVAGSSQSFLGVAFASPQDIGAIAFGRDNGGEEKAFLDRYKGLYILQYTRADNPGAETPDADWTSIGAVYLDEIYPDATGYLRHLYTFEKIDGATGVRILIDGEGVALAIDELEVYSVPEPNVIVLLILGLAGMFAYAWRKRK